MGGLKEEKGGRNVLLNIKKKFKKITSFKTARLQIQNHRYK